MKIAYIGRVVADWTFMAMFKYLWVPTSVMGAATFLNISLSGSKSIASLCRKAGSFIISITSRMTTARRTSKRCHGPSTTTGMESIVSKNLKPRLPGYENA